MRFVAGQHSDTSESLGDRGLAFFSVVSRIALCGVRLRRIDQLSMSFTNTRCNNKSFVLH